MPRFAYLAAGSIALLLVTTSIFAGQTYRADAGQSFTKTCDDDGDGPFYDVENKDDHPADIWNDIPNVKKTFGPVQQDGTRALTIEFTTTDGPMTINAMQASDGSFSGSTPITFAGFSTSVTYDGRMVYDEKDPNKPRKEKATWTVGADGALPDSNTDGKHSPIVFKEKCYYEYEEEDEDSDGVPSTSQTTSSVQMEGTYIQQAGPIHYDVTKKDDNFLEVIMANPGEFGIASDRQAEGDVHFYQGNSIDSTFVFEMGHGSSFTFQLPPELGDGEENVPLDGDINWFIELNDAATQVKSMAMYVDVTGPSFEFLNGDAETGFWRWETVQEPLVGNLDLVTGAFSITLQGRFFSDNLKVSTASEENLPLTFSGVMSGVLPPFTATAKTVDNCDHDANPLQEDADGDGIGDVCDLDLFFSDFDCSGNTDVLDALKEVASAAGVSVQQGAGCPAPGDSVSIEGVDIDWGDTDCDGDRDGQDGVNTIAAILDLPVEQQTPCPDLGILVGPASVDG